MFSISAVCSYPNVKYFINLDRKPLKTSSVCREMIKSKKGTRALRHKNKSSSPEEDEATDGEMEVAPPKQIPRTKTDTNCAALSDFKLQSQIHLEKLEEAYQQSAKNLQRQYRTLILSIDPDILELTQEQFLRLQDAYNRQKANARTPDLVSEQEINDQPVKTTQSPNVTSTRRTTRSSKLADSADADGSVYGTPAKNSDDYNNSPEEDVSIPTAAKSKNSELVPYQPRNSLQQSFSAPPVENPGSLFTGMPLLNLFIPVKNGTAVTVLGRPVDDVGNLPEISPSVMRGLEIMQLNISKLTKAWKEQQQRHSSRKSITAGPSNRK